MKKNWKKIVSYMVCIVMIIGLINADIFVKEVEATTKTQSEAVSWINSAVGKYWDYDGAYGAQCVDLICYYYKYLGAALPGGNGCDYATNALPSGWTRIAYYDGFVAQPGDIAVWKGPTVYGHVALVVSANAQTMNIVENNHDGSGTKVANTYTYRYVNNMNFYGVIRPNFSTGTHTHNYNTYVYYWKSHPHYKCYKCSCGDVESRMNETTEVASCDECMHYATIENKDYYLKNKSNGLYLNVAYGTDEDCTAIHTYKFGDWSSQKYNIVKASDGYEIVPQSSTSGKVVNPYADTVVSGKTVNLYHRTNDSSQWWKFQPKNGGYVIRNVQNPNVCLTINSSGYAIVSTYTGDNSQIWYLETKCKITYDVNGGTGELTGSELFSGQQTEITTVVPKRSGYTFIGWGTAANAIEATYQSGETITVNSDINLYAIWKKNSSSESSNINSQVTVKKTKIKRAIKKSYSTKAKIKLKRRKNVTGYVVKVSTTKKFKKKNTIKKRSTSNVIRVKKLKTQKTYYVKARCYKVVDGKKYYSKWTKVKRMS